MNTTIVTQNLNLENVKATLLIENTWGCIVYRLVTIKKASLVKDSYNSESLDLHYVIKGERKVRGTNFGKQRLVIFESHQSIETDSDEWTCFDVEKFEQIKNSVSAKILYQQ